MSAGFNTSHAETHPSGYAEKNYKMMKMVQSAWTIVIGNSLLGLRSVDLKSRTTVELIETETSLGNLIVE